MPFQTECIFYIVFLCKYMLDGCICPLHESCVFYSVLHMTVQMGLESLRFFPPIPLHVSWQNMFCVNEPLV